jgi:enoyl-[acyl-carrier-protein] reductase (NADH)
MGFSAGRVDILVNNAAEEIAWAVAFVASDQASFMTGETRYVSGGPRVANREDTK